ncbi:hypothetical protein K4H28_14580 [Deefgea tanakiae]|uniref:Uncharacterized protein n=1 Tax=Deefgea tanakiae TaxID=2865840 RepID=A0ABX8Z8K1_9NEIS|nr:hypothetical protein [Deefgea tanakiae]QZA77490.1 hypothetical protein K4H28_14580 [Deefgea tanakiae]
MNKMAFNKKSIQGKEVTLLVNQRKLRGAARLVVQLVQNAPMPLGGWNAAARQVSPGWSLLNCFQWLSGKDAWDALLSLEGNSEYQGLLIVLSSASHTCQTIGLTAGRNLDRLATIHPDVIAHLANVLSESAYAKKAENS